MAKQSRKYSLAGFSQGLTPESASQFHLILIISPIAILALVLFSPLELLSSARAHIGVSLLFAAALIVLNLLVLRETKNVFLAKLVLTATTFVLLFSLFVGGGLETYRLFWLYLLPIGAYFFTGTRRGTLWIIGLFGVLFFLLIIAAIGWLDLPYALADLSQFFLNLAAVSLLAFLFESARVSLHQSAQAKEQELLLTNQKLRSEARERYLTTEQLSERNRDLTQLATDLHNETDRLAEANTRNQAILEGIGDGVFAINQQQRIILFNKSAAQITGYRPDEVIGRPYQQLLRFMTGDQDTVDDRFVTTALQGKGGQMTNQTVLMTKEGRRLPVADSAAPIRNERGKVTGVVVVFRDATQERAIDQAKTEFVSLASHQLRTPLSAIKWYIELLAEGETGQLNADQKLYLSEVTSETRRMTDLIGALLNVSRIELGNFAIELEPTAVEELIKQAIAELEPQLQQRGLKLTAQLTPALPNIQADKKLLGIVIQNLLNNAVKYTPPGGTVSITVKKTTRALIFQVADTGLGIPTNQQAKIFTKLFRADNIRRADTEGTGLGLYIVKSILDHVGGKIWFESIENRGTTFFVSLPLKGMTLTPKAKATE